MNRADITTSPYGRATCYACGREFNLTKKGKIRSHSGDIWIGSHRQICAGSGNAPTRA